MGLGGYWGQVKENKKNYCGFQWLELDHSTTDEMTALCSNYTKFQPETRNKLVRILTLILYLIFFIQIILFEDMSMEFNKTKWNYHQIIFLEFLKLSEFWTVANIPIKQLMLKEAENYLQE